MCVDTGDELVLVDSAIHNRLAAWLISSGLVLSGYRVEAVEPRYGSSRLDLLLRSPRGSPTLLEVKGVTLCLNGVAMFPDAPTERGARHVRELARAVSEGLEAYVLFLVLRRCAKTFAPNWALDRRFSQALLDAVNAGVRVVAYKLGMVRWGLEPLGEIPIKLTPD